MRVLVVGMAVGVLMAGNLILAQDTKTAANTFSNVKLVDTKARAAEQDVTVTVGKEHVRIIDPAAKKDVKTFEFSGLSAMHSFGTTPPGGVAAASTTERHWLTLKSAGDEATLRVSEHVFTQLKAALEAHNVKIEDTK